MALLRRARRGNALHARGGAPVRLAAVAEPADPGVRSRSRRPAAEPRRPAVHAHRSGPRSRRGGTRVARSAGPGARAHRRGRARRHRTPPDRLHAFRTRPVGRGSRCGVPGTASGRRDRAGNRLDGAEPRPARSGRDRRLFRPAAGGPPRRRRRGRRYRGGADRAALGAPARAPPRTARPCRDREGAGRVLATRERPGPVRRDQPPGLAGRRPGNRARGTGGRAAHACGGGWRGRRGRSGPASPVVNALFELANSRA